MAVLAGTAALGAAAVGLGAGAGASSRTAPAGASRDAVRVVPASTSANGGPRQLPAVMYGSDGGPLLMDVYLPAAARPGSAVPVVVVLHGGGWAGGGRSDVTPEAQALAQAGLAVLNPDYRLSAPGSPGYPHQLEDVQLAVAWGRAHAAELGLDMSRVGALGVSAGGNLALELGVRGLVSSVVSWSGPTDLGAFEAPGERCSTPACGPLSLSYAAYQYLGCMPESCPAAYVGASPADRVSAPGVRYLVWNSSDELVPVSQADEFTNRQRSAGRDVTEEVVPGHAHAAEYADAALAPSVAFLVEALSSPSAATAA